MFEFYPPETPDFRVKSICDQEVFDVHKDALQTSEVFRNMFLCCDKEHGTDQLLELDEPAITLRLLLRLLHYPPPPPSLSPSARQARRMGKPVSLYQGALIPFPLLPDMLRLADKYDLSDPLRRSLHSHLFASASVLPLEVYAFATRDGIDDVAAEASAYLLHPPLSSYSRDEIAVIPSVSAYHDLVRLHSYRIQQLRTVVLREDIFPFGYGVCGAHQESTTRAWNDARMTLATQLEAGKTSSDVSRKKTSDRSSNQATDLPAEMSLLLERFDYCKTCHKACLAAIEMLEYKCSRIPRTIDYVPKQEG